MSLIATQLLNLRSSNRNAVSKQVKLWSTGLTQIMLFRINISNNNNRKRTREERSYLTIQTQMTMMKMISMTATTPIRTSLKILWKRPNRSITSRAFSQAPTPTQRMMTMPASPQSCRNSFTRRTPLLRNPSPPPRSPASHPPHQAKLPPSKNWL